MRTGPVMPSGHVMMVTGPMLPPGGPPSYVPGAGYPPHMAQVTGPHVPAAYAYPQPSVAPAPLAGPAPAASPGLLARYKELSGPKKILVVLAPFCLLASGYLILFDEEPPAPQPRGLVDAGAPDARPALVAMPSPPPTPPLAANCPPGYVPWPVPINGTIPCVPATTAGPTTTPSHVSAPVPPPPTAPTRGSVDAGAPPVIASTKTLERMAVDAVAMNEYLRAAKLYEQLLQQNPTNRVYAEAARILRAKADAGAP